MTKYLGKSEVFFDRLDFQILQLAFGGASGAVGHQVLSFLCLGEGDDVPDAFSSGQYGHHPIQSKGYPAMRRSPEGKGLEHVAKSAFHYVCRNLKDVFENLFLQLRLMNPNAAPSQFDSIEHNVVVLPPDFLGIGFE